MCNMLVSKEETNRAFEFIVYNLVFAEASGKFTIDSVQNKLGSYHIKPKRERLESLFTQWAEVGLIFDNVKEYVINSMIV